MSRGRHHRRLNRHNTCKQNHVENPKSVLKLGVRVPSPGRFGGVGRGCGITARREDVTRHKQLVCDGAGAIAAIASAGAQVAGAYTLMLEGRRPSNMEPLSHASR